MTQDDTETPTVPGPDDGRDAVTVGGIEALRAQLQDDTYFVPVHAIDRPVSRLILKGKLSEIGLHGFIEELFRDHDSGSMIHAGTFFGDMIPSFKRKIPGTLFCFEPVFANYVLARETMVENDIADVFLMHAALGEAVGVTSIVTHTGSKSLGGGSRVVEGFREVRAAERTEPTAVMTVDSLGRDDIRLIQLDVEGFELNALKGAAETIARCRPVIIVEDNRKNCADFLEGLGYRADGKVAGNDLYRPD